LESILFEFGSFVSRSGLTQTLRSVLQILLAWWWIEFPCRRRIIWLFLQINSFLLLKNLQWFFATDVILYFRFSLLMLLSSNALAGSISWWLNQGLSACHWHWHVNAVISLWEWILFFFEQILLHWAIVHWTYIALFLLKWTSWLHAHSFIGLFQLEVYVFVEFT